MPGAACHKKLICNPPTQRQVMDWSDACPGMRYLAETLGGVHTVATELSEQQLDAVNRLEAQIRTRLDRDQRRMDKLCVTWRRELGTALFGSTDAAGED